MANESESVHLNEHGICRSETCQKSATHNEYCDGRMFQFSKLFSAINTVILQIRAIFAMIHPLLFNSKINTEFVKPVRSLDHQGHKVPS